MLFKKRNLFLIGILCVVLACGSIVILNNQSTNTNLQAEQVKIKDIKTYYTFSGNIKAKKSEVITLSSETKIKDILVKEGDKVKDGDSLFKTSSDNKIKTNIDGSVSEILVNKDTKYSAGTQIATITNYDALQIDIKIDEYDSSAIKLNDKVDVYINALDKTIEGEIVNLSKNATVENDISYFKAVVEIKDTEDILVGMSVEVKAIKDDVKNVKTISMDALEFDSENQPYVCIKNAKGEIIEKSITIGVNDGSIVEIKSGLKDNDTVVLPNKNNPFMTFDVMQHGGN